MTTDIALAAIAFEGKKVSVNQNKDGVIIRLSIHPHDVPRRVWTDAVGTRYQVAMVSVGDDEQPTVPEETERANRAIKSAGMLCRNEVFQRYMVDEGYAVEASDEAAANALRSILGVESRRDFHENPDAIDQYDKIRDEFLEWRRKNPHELKTERGHG